MKDRDKTILGMLLGLLVLYTIARARPNSPYMLYAALGLCIIAVFIPFLAELIVKGWLKFSDLLGQVTSKIWLTLLFFVFLFPVAMLYRFRGKARDYFKNNGNTTYVDYKKTFTKKDLENIW